MASSDENTTTTTSTTTTIESAANYQATTLWAWAIPSWLDKSTSFGGWNVESSKDGQAQTHVMDRRVRSVTSTRVRGWAR
jgi:hypothetical protein